MKCNIFLRSLFLLLGIVSIAHADSDNYLIRKKCIAKLILSPNKWTYDGTIMFSA